jgi:hypothetical protein
MEIVVTEQHSMERAQAEARFKKAQKASQDAKEAWALYESEARAVREKTARLKALRLAKEAADEKRVDAKPTADEEPVAAKKKRSPSRSTSSPKTRRRDS